MTYKEAIEKFGKELGSKQYRDVEHCLQVSCVNWFRMEHKELAELLFAVPNGGQRDAITGKRLKAEGVLAGVADLFLSIPNEKYHGFYIEMKTVDGRQSPSQKKFEKNVTTKGYKYSLCRSLSDFVKIVTNYLKNME